MAVRWEQRDTDATLAVARTGHFTAQHFESIGYGARRLRTMSCGKEKIFEKVGRDSKTGQEVYKLSNLGKEKAEALGLPRDLQYRGQGDEKEHRNFEHDRKLADIYCSLEQEQRDSWRTEEMYKREIVEIREEIRKSDPERWEEIKDQKCTAFDGGYVDEGGQEHYVEVVTSNYKGHQIESKQNSASLCSGTYTQYKA